MIEPVPVNENRKIPLTTPFKRLLFKTDEEEQDGSVVWHYWNDYLLCVSDGIIAQETDLGDLTLIDDVDIKNSISKLLDGGRYIRPPGEVHDELLHQFERETQTLAEFIISWVDNSKGVPGDTNENVSDNLSEDDLIDSYDPDTSYFESQDELEQTLRKELPRFVFLHTSDQSPFDRPVINIYTQEQMETVGDAPLKKMLLARDIVDDPRVLVAIEELFGEHRDYIAQSIYLTEDDID